MFAFVDLTEETTGDFMEAKVNGVGAAAVDDDECSFEGVTHKVLPRINCVWEKPTPQVYSCLGSVKFCLQEPFEASQFVAGKWVVMKACPFCNSVVLKLSPTSTQKTSNGRWAKTSTVIAQVDRENCSLTACNLFDFLSETRLPPGFEAMISPVEGALSMSISVRTKALKHANDTAQRPADAVRTIVRLFSIFFPDLVSAQRPSVALCKEDCEKFLRAASASRTAPKRWKLNTSSLVPTLRPYQEDAARFMISRELHPHVEMPIARPFVTLPMSPKLNFSPVTAWMSAESPPVFATPPGGILADEMGLGKTVETLALILSRKRGQTVAVDEAATEKPDEVHMLVDELVSTVAAAVDSLSALRSMGSKAASNIIYFTNVDEGVPRKRRKCEKFVEKPQPPATVQCVECGVVCNQARVFWDAFPSQGLPFKCPDCIHHQATVKKVGATLIIAPTSICHQWYEEVKRHIRDDVQVDIYRGVVVEGYKHPEYLATKDIVICAFETLSSEVYFIDAHDKNVSLRRPKRNRISSSPLLAVEWWRICVDEAQVIEGASGNVAEMCWRLAAVNRWCVSGTPVGNSLEGLFGLLAFIGLEPFCYRNWWYHGLWVPYTQRDSSLLEKIFSKILWRNTKENVLDQIFRPPRGSELTVLRFTPVEEQFYREALSWARLRTDRLNRFSLDANLRDLHGKDFDCLMEPFHQVRKFIVCPGLRLPKRRNQRVVANGAAIHEELFHTATKQIEESQRNILLHYNGLAGLSWLDGDLQGASLHYCSALSAMDLLETTNGRLNLTARRGSYRMLRSDRLQKIHTFNAVVDLWKAADVSAGIDAETAKQKLKEAEAEYTERWLEAMKTAQLALAEVMRKIGELPKKSKDVIGWLCEAVRIAQREELDEMIVHCVRNTLLDNQRDNVPLRGAMSLGMLIVSRWDIVAECVNRTLELSDGLLKSAQDIITFVDEVVKCHLADTVNKLNSCVLCVYDKQMKTLESLLYVYQPSRKNARSELENEMEGTGGARKASTMEILMKTISGLLPRLQRSASAGAFGKELGELARECFELIDLWKALLTAGKQCFLTSSEFAARTDEMRQCKLRLQYPTHEDLDKYKKASLPKNFVSKGSETLEHSMHVSCLYTEQLSQTKLLARLRYLSTLRDATANSLDCPVCLESLVGAWIVFPCAHCVCPQCYNQMGRAVCPVCREGFVRDKVSFVELPGKATSLHFLDSDSVTLKVDVSVKLNAVARRVLSIRERDPWSKTLVFTSLVELLPSVCKALGDNGVVYRKFDSSPNRQRILAEFRNDPNISTLVMPISAGARGLNLTCANNIVFVEPMLDVAQLAQAIGRIDRIGQNRAMMIHHFVVYGSVEEQIFHQLADTKDAKWTVRSLMHMLNWNPEKADENPAEDAAVDMPGPSTTGMAGPSASDMPSTSSGFSH